MYGCLGNRFHYLSPAHLPRFGTVKLADRIVVMDDGQVSEWGSHTGLMAAGGLYYRMYTAQAKLFYRQEQSVV